MDVLLIEGQSTLRRLLALALAEEGLTVAAAADGVTGLERFTETPARLVVTELDLPDLRLSEIVAEISHQAPGTPIAVVTTGTHLNEAALVRVAKAVGVAYVFQKPFAPETFLTVVRRLLETAEAQGPAAARSVNAQTRPIDFDDENLAEKEGSRSEDTVRSGESGGC